MTPESLPCGPVLNGKRYSPVIGAEPWLIALERDYWDALDLEIKASRSGDSGHIRPDGGIVWDKYLTGVDKPDRVG